MDANDKKRNKLGYHRTSVACVHCRRRKIRCLVAPDDTEGRCENCIRLRKDCQFFPVDQQPPIEKKSRPSSRLETPSTERSNTTPIASSPTNLMPDPAETFYPYQPMPMNASSVQDMSTYNVGMVQANMSLTPDRPMGPGDFAGHQPMDTGVSWDEFTTIADPQLLNTMAAGKGHMMNMSPNLWNPGTIHSGLPPASPISAASSMGGQAQPMSQTAYAMQPDGTVWQVPPPPPRTMSYPGQEMGSSYPDQFHPQLPPELKRRMTTPAQSLSATSAMGPHGSPGTPEMHTPGSVSYPPGMSYPQWQDMSAMSGMSVVPYPMYSGDTVPQHAYPPNPAPMGHPGGPSKP
ncbi:transcriptional regulator family: Fungal Specific TF [Penicillium roqueforti]|nr:transcriptional regulator family: Fungal Specific TF [Penicillium roqueforti]KAF9240294.1 transcriptional regulator family: Fungal Specific TF [Penicillium roqueforti]KAI1835333.1 transcriptional regulator family: Fungal Specific TF [Penicillium roqueforti]KAI2677346.1 transcriptional regulator family: Fungal Specific TF [Penicillium roqueforti]KAI2688357.1 transcriptional regulator family: Fungal Specific TF [Penicillium roqueforti]KAI2700534.1 transcriptional regulator family: Fungal Spec